MLSIFFLYLNGRIWTENICCQPSSVGEIITPPINDVGSLPIFKLNKVKNVKGKTNLPVEIKCLRVWRVEQQDGENHWRQIWLQEMMQLQFYVK